MTRQEFWAIHDRDDCDTAKLHREYYSQYVTQHVRDLVTRTFTVSVLLDSKDPHLNDIPLKRWDVLVNYLHKTTAEQLKSNGEWLTLGNGVCILKEAARQVIEANK
jgi:hypothetical protein